MTPGTLRALEFDRIVAAVRGLALTPLGLARLAALAPQTDPRRIEAALALTGEGVRFLADHAGFPRRAPDDLPALLTSLAVEGRALDPVHLTGLAAFLESVDQCAHGIRRAPREQFPLLAAVVGPLVSFEREIAEVRRSPFGEITSSERPGAAMSAVPSGAALTVTVRLAWLPARSVASTFTV